MSGNLQRNTITKRTLPPFIHIVADARRAAAGAADYALLYGAWLFLLWSGLPTGICAVLLFCIGVVYETVWVSTPLQATPGKLLFRLFISDPYGDKLKFCKLLWRNSVKYAFTLLAAFIPLQYAAAAALADGMFALVLKKRALHDIAAGSVVTDYLLSFRLKTQKLLKTGNGVVGIYCTDGCWKGSFFPVSHSKIILGRSSQNCQIVFPNNTRGVSSVHCQVFWDHNSRSLIVEDLGSSYGTRLDNGSVLKDGQMAVLRSGQSFCIGENNYFTVKT